MERDEQKAGGEDPRPSTEECGGGEDEVERGRGDEERGDRRGVSGTGAKTQRAGAAVHTGGGEDREEEDDGRGARVGVPGRLRLGVEGGRGEEDGCGGEDEGGSEECPGVNTGAGEGLEWMEGHRRGNA